LTRINAKRATSASVDRPTIHAIERKLRGRRDQAMTEMMKLIIRQLATEASDRPPFVNYQSSLKTNFWGERSGLA
jgi:hypothetical protein